MIDLNETELTVEIVDILKSICDPEQIENVVYVTGKTVSEIDIYNDLGFDSLDAVELALKVETKYDIVINDEDLEKFRTVDDIVKYLLKVFYGGNLELFLSKLNYINMSTLTTAKASVKPRVRGTSSASVSKKLVAKTATPVLEGSISHKFSDGSSFSGTFEQLKLVAAALGETVDHLATPPRGYYFSTSKKGMMKISTMNDYHLRRTLVKVSTDYLDSIYKAEDSNAVFIKKFESMTDNPLVLDLYAELHNRVKTGTSVK